MRSASGQRSTAVERPSTSCVCERLQSTRIHRMTTRLPPSPWTALTHFDEPWVVTTTMRRMLLQPRRGCGSTLPAGRRPRRATQHAVEPALEHRRLRRSTTWGRRARARRTTAGRRRGGRCPASSRAHEAGARAPMRTARAGSPRRTGRAGAPRGPPACEAGERRGRGGRGERRRATDGSGRRGPSQRPHRALDPGRGTRSRCAARGGVDGVQREPRSSGCATRCSGARCAGSCADRCRSPGFTYRHGEP